MTPEMIGDTFRELLSGTDFEMISIKVQPMPGRVRYAVVLDHRQRGITIAEITRWSRRFEEKLDLDDGVPRQYALDVSSPGLNQPLSEPWQFSKNVGRELKVELQPQEGEKQRESFTAKLETVAEDVLNFEGGRTVTLDQVRVAKVALPW